jgi:hypothetical protein
MADDAAATNPDATAPPPAQIDTTVPTTATLPEEQAPQYQQPAAAQPAALAPVQTPTPTPPNNLAVKVYHGIMGALGGTQDVSYSRDPTTGKMIATTTPSGPGTQWKRMIAGVVQGTAAGLGAAPGPGQMGRAAGAGIQAASQGAQQADQQKQQQANQDFEANQKLILNKAQTQALTYEGAVNAFKLSRMQAEAAQTDSDRENVFAKLIQGGGTSSQDLGVAKSFADIIQMHKDMPGLMEQNAHGNIIQTAHVNADGIFDGTRFALVTPEWKNAKLDHDVSFYQLQPPSKPGDKAKVISQTVKAGTMSNGDFANSQTAASNEILKWQADEQKETHQEKVDDSTIAKNKAERAQAYAAANRDNALADKTKKEAAAVVTPTDEMSDNEIVKGMLDGSIDITKTASIRGNARAAYIAAAKKVDPSFNMQDYNKKLKTAMAFSGDGKQAQQIQSFNTFLGHALDYSQSVNALRNSNMPLINKPVNWLKANAAGNPVVSQMAIQAEAVKTEFQNFLNNNHALLSQDKEQGLKMLDNDMSPAQQQAAMKQFVTTAAVRMSAVNHTYYTQFGKDAPNMLDEDGKASLQHFGVPESMVYHHPTGVPSTTVPSTQLAAPPQGKVTVQIPGQAAAFIPIAGLAQFQKDHPNAPVRQQ